MTGLTSRQADILAAIRDLTFDGVPPTVREIAEHVGITSRGGVHDLLSRLKGRGVITWEPHKPRSIQIIEDAVSPVVLNKLSDDCLRRAAAHIAGILAARGGAYAVASAYRNIADQLLRPEKAA